MRLNTKGLVIRESNTGESDRIITVLTGDYGIVRAFVRGAKKIKGSFQSSTGLLCYSDFSFYKGRDAYIVDEAQTIEVFFNLRESIERLSLAQYFCELAAELCPEMEDTTEYLRLFLNSLHMLASGKRPQLMLKAVTELRLLSVAGYMPDLVCCRSCKKYEDEYMYFDVENACFICPDCGGSGIKTGMGTIAAMRHICFSDFEKIYSFNLSEQGFNDLADICEKYLLSSTQRKYKTLDFYKSVQ